MVALTHPSPPKAYPEMSDGKRNGNAAFSAVRVAKVRPSFGLTRTTKPAETRPMTGP